MTEARLMTPLGSRIITRDELQLIAVPPATRTHQPLSHYDIVTAIIESLGFRHLEVIKDAYAVSPNGMKMFGVMDLSDRRDDFRFSIGIRNANDKSMRFALTVGYRVLVCDSAIRSTETM
jgi:hypothetical protein